MSSKAGVLDRMGSTDPQDLQPPVRKRSALEELMHQKKLERKKTKEWTAANVDHPIYGEHGSLWD